MQIERARLQVQIDQADQHEDRAEERVDEELQRGVDATRAAPDADEDEHRDQHRLEEHVEQQRVRRAEHADHQAFEHQHGGHVLVRLVLDNFPGTDDDQDADECGQQDQRHGNAVDRQAVVHVKRSDPQMAFGQLHTARIRVVLRDEKES